VAEPRFLLDSNILIYLLGGLSLEARAQVEGRAAETIVTSAIVFAEVMLGAKALEAEAQARRLFANLQVLPFDAAAGRVYATLPFKRGRFDRLVAAHAVALDLTLVTNNERDFADIPALKVENWTL